jgi:hypothetical protein
MSPVLFLFDRVVKGDSCADPVGVIQQTMLNSL